MDKFESLSHTAWECKYHVVFIPKCCRKTRYRQLRQHLGKVFRKLAVQKECGVEEGHLMVDRCYRYPRSEVGRGSPRHCAITPHGLDDLQTFQTVLTA